MCSQVMSQASFVPSMDNTNPHSCKARKNSVKPLSLGQEGMLTSPLEWKMKPNWVGISIFSNSLFSFLALLEFSVGQFSIEQPGNM